ncbi:helix-turn-helix transcriptional regulator [Sphingobacterium sp. SYP-B4668]|uniref:helix-turn-helix transcriptional regulator n=1 Tax=Sphingobacterium sp. SYP-B4668 TaxID=2996035 RepID=UPI0022DD1BD8|nr:AraC family transcriptional regulator [Sphingobacterium sp. SYP-B4668]
MSQVAERVSLHTRNDYEVKHMSLDEDFIVHNTMDNSSILVVSTRGKSTLLVEQEHIELKEEHCCFVYSKGVDLYLAAENAEAQVLMLTFRDGFLESSEIEFYHHENMITLLRSFTAPHTFYVPSLHTTVLDLVHTQFPERLASTFYRAKSLNIFCRLLEHLELVRERKNVHLREMDVEKVNLAKRIIENNLGQNYTIPQLAREVGTNEQYLKKHFKLFFGKTVFNYILECKMQKAKQLLKDHDLKISMISQQLGYKHATHFTTAFKKFFGYVPNSLRYMAIVTLNSIDSLGECALLVL